LTIDFRNAVKNAKLLLIRTQNLSSGIKGVLSVFSTYMLSSAKPLSFRIKKITHFKSFEPMLSSFPFPWMFLDQIFVRRKYLLLGLASFFGFVELCEDLHAFAVRLVVGVYEAGRVFWRHCVKESVTDYFLFLKCWRSKIKNYKDTEREKRNKIVKKLRKNYKRQRLCMIKKSKKENK